MVLMKSLNCLFLGGWSTELRTIRALQDLPGSVLPDPLAVQGHMGADSGVGAVAGMRQPFSRDGALLLRYSATLRRSRNAVEDQIT